MREEIERRTKETPPSKDIWRLRGVLTISGESGTGKTSIARFLSDWYSCELFTVGEFFRKKFPNRMIGYQERDPKVDREADEEIRRRTISALKDGKPLIIEGKMAFTVAQELLQSNELTDEEKTLISTSIIIASEDVRMQRIYQRELQKAKEKSRKPLSYQEIVVKTLSREEKDMLAWSIVHSELKSENPFDVSNPDVRQKYKLVIDANTGDQNTVAARFHKQLLEKGLVEIRLQQKPKENIVFGNPES